MSTGIRVTLVGPEHIRMGMLLSVRIVKVLHGPMMQHGNVTIVLITVIHTLIDTPVLVFVYKGTFGPPRVGMNVLCVQ